MPNAFSPPLIFYFKIRQKLIISLKSPETLRNWDIIDFQEESINAFVQWEKNWTKNRISIVSNWTQNNLKVFSFRQIKFNHKEWKQCLEFTFIFFLSKKVVSHRKYYFSFNTDWMNEIRLFSSIKGKCFCEIILLVW